MIRKTSIHLGLSDESHDDLKRIWTHPNADTNTCNCSKHVTYNTASRQDTCDTRTCEASVLPTLRFCCVVAFFANVVPICRYLFLCLMAAWAVGYFCWFYVVTSMRVCYVFAVCVISSRSCCFNLDVTFSGLLQWTCQAQGRKINASWTVYEAYHFLDIGAFLWISGPYYQSWATQS